MSLGCANIVVFILYSTIPIDDNFYRRQKQKNSVTILILKHRPSGWILKPDNENLNQIRHEKNLFTFNIVFLLD